MTVTQVNYECNDLPEDASPAWEISGSTASRSVSNGILTISNAGAALDVFHRDETAFDKAHTFARAKCNNLYDILLVDSTQNYGIGFASNGPNVMRIFCGDLTTDFQNVSLDNTEYHTFTVKFSTVAVGLPKARFWIDGEYVGELTSPTAFTPERVRVRTGSTSTAQYDYIRYKLQGIGSSHSRRVGGIGDMIPDKKPELVKKKEKREPRTVYVTFPADGSVESVAAGDLLLNFWDGTARLPDGTEKKLSGKLEGSGHEWMNSIYFDNPDQNITISLDNMGSFLIEANSFRGIILQPFRQAKIRTTATTSIKVFASTDGKSGLVAA